MVVRRGGIEKRLLPLRRSLEALILPSQDEDSMYYHLYESSTSPYHGIRYGSDDVF